MTSTEAPHAETPSPASESRPFEADVSRLLHLMVHSVYSDRDIFLRELIANGADACEKLRTLALQDQSLLGEAPDLAITITADAPANTLTVADSGIGMSREELVDALGTIARSGTRAFLEALGDKGEGSPLIGQFGVGFYSAFMVAKKVDVLTRRAGSAEAWLWSSSGEGTYTVEPLALEDSPVRGTRVVLHLAEGSESYAEGYTVERIVREHGSAVPVPVDLIVIAKPEKEGEAPVVSEPRRIADGAAIWTKPKSAVSPEDYKSFYEQVSGQFDEPALTLHYRAEGRQDYSVLAFVPETRPLALFDPMRKGRMKLYVRRMFIADDIDLLPGYLRFVSGVIDSADLPLNLSRETIQESPILAAIRKAVANRLINEFEKVAEKEPERWAKIWDAFGPVIKEGLYEDFERRDALYKIARFVTSTHPEGGRSVAQIVADLRPNQTAIWYLVGDDAARLKASPHLEGFRARGIEVLLLSDPIDAFWVQTAMGYEGKPFRSVTQGAADIANVPLAEGEEAKPQAEVTAGVATLLAFVKETLGDAVRRCARLRSTGREPRLPRRLRDGAGPRARAAARRPWPHDRGEQARAGAQPLARHGDAPGGNADSGQGQGPGRRRGAPPAGPGPRRRGPAPIDAAAFAARLGRLMTRAFS